MHKTVGICKAFRDSVGAGSLAIAELHGALSGHLGNELALNLG